MRLIVLAVAVFVSGGAAAQEWTTDEKTTLRSLWIGSLKALPSDPSNRYADDPRAIALGHKLFFDTRLSSNSAVSCATCHQPDRAFTDGRALAEGVGVAARHSPTLVGVAYSPWFFWDGRKDSQWSQALGPLEAAVEHGGTRTQYVKLILTDPSYRVAYEEIFGAARLDVSRLPDRAMPGDDAWDNMQAVRRDAVSRVYANIGKAIAAFERRILPGPSRFDRYVAGVLNKDASASEDLLPDEIAGLRLFIGQGNCTQCHNGPLLTNNEFHNTGLPAVEGEEPDTGRAGGVRTVFADEFNCTGRFSDAGLRGCGELLFAKTEGPGLVGAFKSPTLRNVADTAPYMHDGRFATLGAVLEHYSNAPASAVGQSELLPLNLTEREIRQLEQFLRTLSGPLAMPDSYLAAPR